MESSSHAITFLSVHTEKQKREGTRGSERSIDLDRLIEERQLVLGRHALLDLTTDRSAGGLF